MEKAQDSESVGSSTSELQNANKSSKQRSTASKWWHGTVDFMIDQWFLITLGILVIIASQVNVPLSQQDIKETVVSYTCVSVIFVITGCTLSTKALTDNYKRWTIHLYVQIQCFLMCSAVMYGVVSLCATNPDFMDPALLVGLVLAGCVPTTIASNVMMTRQAGGRTALTVVESTLGNFLGPFITPVLFRMYISPMPWYTRFLPADAGGYGELYSRVFMRLGLSLFLPLAVGQVIQWLFPNVTRKLMVDYKLSKLGSLALLIILWSAYDSAFATGALTTLPASNALFLVFGNIGFFTLFLVICVAGALPWLPDEDVVAIAYCVPAKTPAIGIPIAQTLFVGLTQEEQAKIQIPMVIYQGLQVAAGSLLTIAFRRWMEHRQAKKRRLHKGETDGSPEIGESVDQAEEHAPGDKA